MKIFKRLKEKVRRSKFSKSSRKRLLKIKLLVVSFFVTLGTLLLLARKWLTRGSEDDGEQTKGLNSKQRLPKKTQGWSRIQIAAAIFVVAILMMVVSAFEVDEYFKASLLTSSQQAAIKASAQARIGVTYGLGETGPDAFDCSGLVNAVVNEALGINLPRSSKDIYTVGRDIAFDKVGVGDLLFFKTYGDDISHVGIVTKISGDRIFMTNANSYLGYVVEEEVTGYWSETYVGAREITSVTATETTLPIPDLTYTAPTDEDDQYNDSFPPSEEADPRLNEVTVASSLNESGTTEVTEAREIDASSNIPFPDVPVTDPHYLAIKTLKDKGIISGYPDGTFKSDRIVTRAESLKIASGGTGIDTDSYAQYPSNFSDVDSSHSLWPYIAYAEAQRFVNGYEDGTFKPDRMVSNGEGTKMIERISGINPPLVNSDPYLDVSKDLDLAKYIAYAKSNNLHDVYGAFYGINNRMSRGEVAEMMYRILKLRGEV